MLRLLSKKIVGSSVKKVPVIGMSRRWLQLMTVSTPNENSLKYVTATGELFQPRGSPSVEIKNTDDELIKHSKTLTELFLKCPGVESLMIGDDFLTVNKDEQVHWATVSPSVTEILTNHFASGSDIVDEEFLKLLEQTEREKHKDVGYDIKLPEFEMTEDEQEISEMIHELIQTRIRPAIMDDGGDIVYRGFDPKTGKVYVKLQGACKSCSSSEDTLKHGIESMMKHYVEEVTEVVQILDPEEQIALKEFDKLEQKLQSNMRTHNT
ncbi:hypothetical protein TPHA_0N01300 [Tetrapisispora phaffii CBS 4417]|uniref:Scaffold protein Nfu/NifU N-terminal domain-containing protein n=1 Tax=Tetrapisispora phaffii (strain ATCC 24235 / CBS 4417 / NBRC 1672 / NRRL Y-8282 / UCD 70-5) TaxID=1071381 RepID=G8C183_TETPH|nr:hypothetical protein TPHA_0N01300 [Tetrapisispora phaffii CBS 4417]CCE65911.1 hypothetical protein TPHA_0N01300 [Tetrapisispora phaffii CBS 4417]